MLRSMVDMGRASDFMDTHARVIDRRRYELLFGDGDAEAALAALAGYANADGGFGWALEPDLRAAGSQPVGALHAFEVFAEVAPATSPMAVRLCDWLQAASLPDGGLPFALTGAAGPGTAPHWAGAVATESSLHITSAVCGIAHRVAAHDRAVAEHAWLARATEYCRDEISKLERPGGAYELRYALQLLDALHDGVPWAAGDLERLGRFIPASGAVPVAGGTEAEQLRPLDFTDVPDRPLRALFTPAVVAADLDRLEDGQRDDGGWTVDWQAFSPAAAVEWRGYKTLHALTTLRANGRLGPA